MKPASVSYIVAVYNGERYLAEAIDSILAQTLPAAEIIVVDDGSTDQTAACLTPYGDRITDIHQPNAGQSAARNHGARIARGEFLAFLDADDLIHPRKLERQMERFGARSDLALCSACVRNFWSPEIPAAERRPIPHERFTHSEEPWPDHISTWLLRRTLFDEIGGFKEGMMFSEDEEWLDRVRVSGAPIETLVEVLARRRLHPNCLTRRHYEKSWEGILRISKGRIDRLRGRP